MEKTVGEHHGGVEGKKSRVVSGKDDGSRRRQILDASAFDAEIVAVKRQKKGKGVGYGIHCETIVAPLGLLQQ